MHNLLIICMYFISLLLALGAISLLSGLIRKSECERVSFTMLILLSIWSVFLTISIIYELVHLLI